eukprot:1607774-Pyramimonas_sp.AAC.1
MFTEQSHAEPRTRRCRVLGGLVQTEEAITARCREAKAEGAMRGPGWRSKEVVGGLGIPRAGRLPACGR